MAKYKEEITEETITTKSYTRAYKIEFLNPVSQQLMAIFDEERVEEVNGGAPKSLGKTGHIEEAVSDINERFDLLDPTDDSKVGTMTYGEVYAVLYSLYFHVAAKRDA